jgi:EF-hand domain pair
MYLSKTLFLSMMIASKNAFALSTMNTVTRAPYFATLVEPETVTSPSSLSTELPPSATPKLPSPNNKKKPAPAAHGKEGIFSPVVQLSKEALGEKKLNEVRAKAIGLHSDVIGKFVESADSSVGNAVLKALFSLADRNQNGTVEEEELADALKVLGFDLKPKQIAGIFQRADVDESRTLDFDEWRQEAPKTLRTNLIKLAKKNGGELGFLV